MKSFVLITVVSLSFPLLAMAQTSGSMAAAPMGSTTEKLSIQDSHFIKMASVAGLAEVHDGQLAETMGSVSVKAIGTRMVTDHGKANDELTSIATTDGVTAPTMVDPMHAATNAKLKMLSGSSFDEEYLQTELVGHEKTIALFEMEASSGSASNLKSFASSTLPTLKDHLAMIKMAMN